MPEKIKRKFKNKKAVLIICIAFLAMILVALDIPAGVRSIIFGSSDVPENFGKGDELDVVFFDVGQGDSALIGCGGHYALIDAGEADMGYAVLRYLDKLKVKKLDAVIISHPHSDHMGGAATVIENIKTQKLIMRVGDSEDESVEELIDTAKNHKAQLISPDSGDEFMAGDIKISVLYPDKGEKFENLNNASLVLLAEYADMRVLFTGDMESGSEREVLSLGIDISADLLKVAHHGSDSSSTEEFLSAVKPDIAVISCGEGNEFGHPHEEVLKRLQKQGAEIYITSFDGSIYFSFAIDEALEKKAS